MFYLYVQNNSGGTFEFNEEKGIGYWVAIEADSVKEADEKATEIGLYFNGVSQGIDCPCCGDRWSSAEWADAYDEDEEEIKKYFYERDNSRYIHYKDGSFKKVEDQS